MNHLPASLALFSRVWWLSLVVLVVADVAGMLATFMPMKVILILASGDVPGFFPQFLVDGGAVFASMVLLALAAGLGVLAWFGGVLIERFDVGGVRSSGQASGVRVADWSAEALREAKQVRGFAVSLVLVFPVAGVLLVVSPAYLGFTAVWLVVSALGVVWRVRRSAIQGPYFSGLDRVSHELADWLRRTALWSMVGLALVTLLVAPPVLGSTAILIAAIFGRRLTVAMADVVPRATVLVTDQASKRASSLVGQLVKNQPTAQTVKWPIEFLASTVGARKWGKYLQESGFGPRDFTVLGSPTGPALSLVVGAGRDEQLLVRIFGTQHGKMRDAEKTRREQPGGGLYPTASVRGVFVAGFPALEIPLTTHSTRLDPDVAPSRDHAIAFQLERERQTITELADGGAIAPLGITVGEWVDLLERAARIPGAHGVACRKMIPGMSRVVDIVEQLPAALVAQRPLGPGDCYIAEDGGVCYLGGLSWSVGRMGDSWGPVSHYEKALGRIVTDQADGHPQINVDAVALNAEQRALQRALTGFKLEQIPTLVTAITTRLRAMP